MMDIDRELLDRIKECLDGPTSTYFGSRNLLVEAYTRLEFLANRASDDDIAQARRDGEVAKLAAQMTAMRTEIDHLRRRHTGPWSIDGNSAFFEPGSTHGYCGPIQKTENE